MDTNIKTFSSCLFVRYRMGRQLRVHLYTVYFFVVYLTML
jgi:hypothetical protein